MLPVLLVLFIVVPLAELALIIQVGQEIGVLATIAVLLLDSIIGAVLLRTQGRLAWRRFAATLQAGRPPAREVLDGALVLVGGVLLLTPGFLTDLTGILLLLPPTRALARRALGRRLLERMAAGMVARRGGHVRVWTPGRAGAVDDDIVEGTATDAEPPRRLDR